MELQSTLQVNIIILSRHKLNLKSHSTKEIFGCLSVINRRQLCRTGCFYCRSIRKSNSTSSSTTRYVSIFFECLLSDGHTQCLCCRYRHENLILQKSFKPNFNKGVFCRRGGGHSPSKSWRLSPFHSWFYPFLTIHPGIDKLATLPPQIAPSTEISTLEDKLSHAMEGMRVKNSNLTVHDLKRLLFRCAATLISLKKVRPTNSSVKD